MRLVLFYVVNRQVSKRLRVAVERARELVCECPHESRGSRFDHHLGVGVDSLTVLVLEATRESEYTTKLEDSD